MPLAFSAAIVIRVITLAAWFEDDAKRDTMHPRDAAMLFIEGSPMSFIQKASGLTFGTDEGELIFGEDSSLVRARGGNDGLRLGDDSDIAHLSDGDDVAYGGGGSDSLLGEGDDDLIDGGAGNDWLIGGEGDDMLRGGPGNDQLLGGPGDDILVAIAGSKSGNNTLYGDAGNDLLHGGTGQDVLFGGEGDDILFASGDDDWIQGGTGADQIQGERGDDIIFGSADENGEPIDGSSTEIFYVGDDGNDEINAFSAENDQLIVSANINDTGIESLADLAGRVTEGDDGAAIALGEQTQILMTGVAADDINANMADYVTIA